MNIKMSDVAKRAGVSIATVGRVLNNNGYVSAEKRTGIENAIQELGFVPNSLAQGLKKSESRIIGHLTMFSMNMQMERISREINQHAAKNGYHVLTVAGHSGRDDGERFIQELIGRRVDGVIITSNQQIRAEHIRRLTDLGIPVVMIERTMELPHVDRIVVDDRAGAFDAVTHMIRKGHRDIGFIGCGWSHTVEMDRRQGFADALREADIRERIEWIQLRPDYSVEDGYEAAREMFEGKSRPTAVFATSDILAGGLMQRLYDLNLRVPDDVSVIGYDNTIATLLSPPISSMGLPHEQIGEEAMTLLMKRMENKELPTWTMTVTPSLKDRQTVRVLERV